MIIEFYLTLVILLSCLLCYIGYIAVSASDFSNSIDEEFMDNPENLCSSFLCTKLKSNTEIYPNICIDCINNIENA